MRQARVGLCYFCLPVLRLRNQTVLRENAFKGKKKTLKNLRNNLNRGALFLDNLN
jgi:hypothetical protein